MMISGLLSNSNNNSFQKTPGLANLPIIGALFRSNGFQRNETELVVIITPYLVKPVNNARDIALPTDGARAPSDIDRVLLGTLSGKSGGPRPVPTVAPSPYATPSVGAVAPVLPAPQPDLRRDKADARSTKSTKGIVPAPGFSN
jgi:pilus assembly protein CpaC